MNIFDLLGLNTLLGLLMSTATTCLLGASLSKAKYNWCPTIVIGLTATFGSSRISVKFSGPVIRCPGVNFEQNIIPWDVPL